MTRLPVVGSDTDTWGDVLNALLKRLHPLRFGPDIPNAGEDDEFDGASTVSYTPSPSAATAVSINGTYPDIAYLKSAYGDGRHVGRFKLLTGSYPQSHVLILRESTCRANFQRGGGICITTAPFNAASRMVYFGLVYNSGLLIQRVSGNNFGLTFVENGASVPVLRLPVALKVTFASASVCTFSVSFGGDLFVDVETITLTDANKLNGASAGAIGWTVSAEGGSTIEATFEALRKL